MTGPDPDIHKGPNKDNRNHKQMMEATDNGNYVSTMHDYKTSMIFFVSLYFRPVTVWSFFLWSHQNIPNGIDMKGFAGAIFSLILSC